MELTQEYLSECFCYHHDTGDLVWKMRPREHFNTDSGQRIANNLHAGVIAGVSNSRGYISIKVNGKLYRAHRLIWLLIHGAWPRDEIDHIDGNPSNNKLENLREATRLENTRNKRKLRSTACRYKGVTRTKSGKFYAQIGVDYKSIYSELFHTEEEAHAAYVEMADKYFGAFANYGDLAKK